MNRKEFLKSLPLAAGLAIAAPSLVAASNRNQIIGVPSGGAPTPMPPDTRTNDEVWEAYVNEGPKMVERLVLGQKQYPSYTHYKWVNGTDRIGYDRIKKLVAERGWTFVETIRDGVTTFEVEGLLFRLY